MGKIVDVIEDFPKEGIKFYDLSPLFRNVDLLDDMLGFFASKLTIASVPDKILAIEARGFILGAMLVQEWGAGLVMCRKNGKLPDATTSRKYGLEYGSDELNVHLKDLCATDRVAIVDDVLATGGTALAAAELVKSFNAEITMFVFILEVESLKGREKIQEVYPDANIVCWKSLP